jgi:O-antigen ligase
MVAVTLTRSRPSWKAVGHMLGGVASRPIMLAVLAVLAVGFPGGTPSSGVSTANVTPADVLAVALVGVIALKVVAGGGDLRVLRAPTMAVPVIMVAVAVLSTMLSTDPAFSAAGLLRFVEIFLLLPVAVVLAVTDVVDVVMVLSATVFLAVVEGGLGTFQALTGTGARFGAVSSRAVGTFGIGDQIAMASVVSVGMLVLLAVALRLPQARGRWWAAAGLTALAVPLLLSLSRGGLIGFLAAAVVMVAATGLRQAIRTTLVAVAVAVVAMSFLSAVNPTVAARFSTVTTSATEPDRSVQDRYDLWTAAISMWRSRPLTGVGVKQFATFRDSNAPLDLSSGSDQAGGSTYVRVQLLSPHNEYLLLLSEQGILGLGAYLLLLCGLLVRHLTRIRSPAVGTVDSVLRLVVLGLLVRYGVDTLYGDVAGPTAVLFSILLGLQLRSAVATSSPLAVGAGLRPAGQPPVAGVVRRG